MKRTKKIVKRDIYRDRSAADPANQEPDGNGKDQNRVDCSGTAVVYCNQWECFSRFICQEDD